jgi:hypothetical protein
MPITTRAVLLAAAVDAAIGLLLFSVFSVLRIAKGSDKFFSPRRWGGGGLCYACRRQACLLPHQHTTLA